MTDAHESTPSEEHDPSIEINPDYDEYGLQSIDDGTAILRLDRDKHLFERIGLIKHKQAGIVLKQYIETTGIDGESSFSTVESISAGRDEFESRLRDGVIELIYEGRVDEGQAKSLADHLAESISEQYR